MRRDNKLFEKLAEERLHENSTGCCLQTFNTGCIQRQQTECSVSLMMVLVILFPADTLKTYRLKAILKKNNTQYDFIKSRYFDLFGKSLSRQWLKCFHRKVSETSLENDKSRQKLSPLFKRKSLFIKRIAMRWSWQFYCMWRCISIFFCIFQSSFTIFKANKVCGQDPA